MPINKAPHLVEERRPHVLVVKVIGVLPDVDSEQWDKLGPLILHHVLIRRLHILQLFRVRVVGEPAPATTLQSGGAPVEVLLEALDAAPLSFHECAKLAALVRQVSTAIWDGSECVPEELVVQVTTAVELDLAKKAAVFTHVVSIATLQRFKGLLLQSIEVINVGAMMLAIMEVHQVTTDDRLECAKLIRQRLKLDTLRSPSHLGSASKSTLLN